MIVGVGAVVNVNAGTAFAALVFEVEVYPDFVALTVTVMLVPPSAATNLYVEAVAPVIAVPLRFH